MTTAQFGVILNQPARIAATAAIASIPPITMLLMESTAPVDPIWTLSDYIVSRPDGIALFAMTAAALAIGGVALAHGAAVDDAPPTLRLSCRSLIARSYRAPYASI